MGWLGARPRAGPEVPPLGPAPSPSPPLQLPHHCFFNWSSFTSLLTHRRVLLRVDAYCFIHWDLPGDVLAAPESALYGWIGVILLSLSHLERCLPCFTSGRPALPTCPSEVLQRVAMLLGMPTLFQTILAAPGSLNWNSLPPTIHRYATARGWPRTCFYSDLHMCMMSLCKRGHGVNKPANSMIHPSTKQEAKCGLAMNNAC